jgi:hypothetical protein
VLLRIILDNMGAVCDTQDIKTSSTKSKGGIMLNILKFIFEDGWHYFGMLILIFVAGKQIQNIIYEWRDCEI